MSAALKPEASASGFQSRVSYDPFGSIAWTPNLWTSIPP